MTPVEKKYVERDESGRLLLSSVGTAMDILDLFSSFCPELGLSEISRRMGIGKSRAHRLLVALKSRNFIEQDPQTGYYRPGISNLWLGRLYEGSNRLIQESRPLAQELARQIHHVVHVATLVEGELVYMVRELPEDAPRWSIIPSTRVLPHATALGKAMMACLEDREIEAIVKKTGLPRRTLFTITTQEALMERVTEIRRRGFALDDEECYEDQLCIGVALKNINGQLLGAMSISGKKRLLPEATIEEYSGLLKSISNVLAGRMGPYVLPVQMVPGISRNKSRLKH